MSNFTPFGRDQQSLPTLGSGAASPFAAPPKGGGAGKSRGGFVRNFIPPAVGVPFWVVFHYTEVINRYISSDGNVSDQTAPFKRIMQHWHAGKKTFTICSAGPDYYNPDTAPHLCSGCKVYYANRKYVVDPKNPSRGSWENTGPVGRSEAFALSMAVLEPHYAVASKSVNASTGIPYDDWVLPGDSRLPDHRTPSGRAALAKLKTRQGNRYVYNVNRSMHSVLFGGATPGAGIDEQLRRNCTSCNATDMFDVVNGEDTCTSCQQHGTRAHLFNSAIQLEAAIAGAPKTAGGRPPITFILKKWAPLYEFQKATGPDGALLWPAELFEAISLEDVVAPTPAARQAAVYGEPPAQTSQGRTGLVDVPASDLSRAEEQGGGDDDTPF